MDPLYILSASSVCLLYSTSDYLTKYKKVYHASRYPVSGAEKVVAPPPPTRSSLNILQLIQVLHEYTQSLLAVIPPLVYWLYTILSYVHWH